MCSTYDYILNFCAVHLYDLLTDHNYGFNKGEKQMMIANK